MEINVYSVLFDKEGSYKKLAEILRRSVKKNIPKATFHLELVPEAEKLNEGAAYNHIKLGYWNAFIQKTTRPTLLLDCDILIRKDIREVFQQNFDVALTYHDDPTYYPINAGVVFVHPTKSAKCFFREWYKADSILKNTPEKLKHYRERYAGMNQASLGYLREEKLCEYKELLLPCSIYNAYRKQEFPDLTNDLPKIVHLKGDLRHLYKKRPPNKRPTNKRQELIEKVRAEVLNY